MRAPIPEPSPLATTICRGSLSAICLIQLFSSPQQIVAPRTKSEPKEKENPSAIRIRRQELRMNCPGFLIHSKLFHLQHRVAYP